MAAYQDVTVTIVREVELSVVVRVYPAVPATAPSYASGGDPPEAASAEVLSFTVLGSGFSDALTEDEESDAEQLALEEQAFHDEYVDELCDGSEEL